jgi:hypothetical protein
VSMLLLQMKCKNPPQEILSRSMAVFFRINLKGT